jgi:integrase
MAGKVCPREWGIASRSNHAVVSIEICSDPVLDEWSAFWVELRPDGPALKAKRRLDAEILAARTKRASERGVDPFEMPHWTLHDLRTSFNTLACDVLAVDIHVADRILNHVAGATTSKVMQVYNRSELFEMRKRARAAGGRLLEKEVIRKAPGRQGHFALGAAA